jgi:hypothetical protein
MSISRSDNPFWEGPITNTLATHVAHACPRNFNRARKSSSAESYIYSYNRPHSALCKPEQGKWKPVIRLHGIDVLIISMDLTSRLSIIRKLELPIYVSILSLESG